MILVTGATGILGRVIVLDLLKQGHQVRATKRKSSNLEEVKSSFRFYTDDPVGFYEKIEWIEVDFDDIESLKAALIDVTEVYHCAAKVSFHPDDRKEMYHSNIVGTRNLLYACENFPIKKFCFISSIAVLDGTDENGEITEDSNYNSKIHHSKYAKSKHFSEMEVWRASAEGLNTVIINPGVIIGSGNWESSSGEIFGTFEKYPYAMSGSSNYIDVRDVAKIAINLMDQKIFNERFTVISENKKLVEVADLIRAGFGKSEAKVVPKFILNIGYVLNVMFGWFIRPLKIINRINIEAVTSHNIVSNEKIKKRLNFHFIPITESLDFHLKNYISDQKEFKK